MSTVIFIKNGSNWIVPADWNNTDNSIECIGGGGGGGAVNTASTPAGSSGGGGGAWAKIANVALTPGASIPIGVGAAGLGATGAATTNPTDGGDTWFGAITANAALVKAAGGKKGANGSLASPAPTGGLGALTVNCIGDSYSAGGNGGSATNDGTYLQSGGGGGGAGGPHGSGANGGNAFGQGGGGGGGADGGGNGATPGSATATGALGGTSRLGTGAGTASGLTGGAGSVGGGGGSNKGQNSHENVWTDTLASETAGPGSGCAGSTGAQTPATLAAGAYGNGGAGGGSNGGGAGGPGLIVITYNPNTGAPGGGDGGSGGVGIGTGPNFALATVYGTDFFGTITDLLNAAFLEIGATTIIDPNEVSPQAIVARQLYPRVVRAELRKNAWSFALDRTKLAAMDTAPSFGYSVQYQLPPDFIRLYMVGATYIDPVLNDYVGSDSRAFVIEGRRLLTNEPAPLPIRYIKDLQNTPNLWDALFFEVVALRLALKMIPSTVKSDSKYQLIEKAYVDLIKTAKRLNAIELPPVPLTDNSWDIGRL